MRNIISIQQGWHGGTVPPFSQAPMLAMHLLCDSAASPDRPWLPLQTVVSTEVICFPPASSKRTSSKYFGETDMGK